MFISKLRAASTVLGFVALLSIGAAASAEDTKIPQTAAEHQARATEYRKEAAQFHASAEEHKQMAADYSKSHPDFKGGVKNPFNEKMQKHCAKLANEFEQLAKDAETAASYHDMRAKELQGK